MRLTIARFSCKSAYLRCPLGRSLAVLSGFSLPTPFNRLPSDGGSVTSRSLVLLQCEYRNINRLSIMFASRLPLRSRLTLIRLTLFRKPWVFGVNISIFIVVTYAYIFFSGRSRKPHDSPSTHPQCSPTDCTSRYQSQSFGCGLDARSSSMRRRSTSELLRTL